MAIKERQAFQLSDLLGKTPAPIQIKLLKSKEYEIGMVTGFAAGKTRGLCAASIYHCVKYPKARALVGRKTFAEMINTVKNPFFHMAYPMYKAGWFVRPVRWDYREGTNLARFINGSEIIFSNLDDPVKFRNEEYSAIFVDQAEEIDEELWETLIARVRWDRVPQEGWQVVASANDNGHNWIWKRFVFKPKQHEENPYRCLLNLHCMFEAGHPDEDGNPRPEVPCATRRFFHATTLENRHNLSPRYLATLLVHPREWQRHFIYATMEGGAGRLLPDPTIVSHFEPPVHWPRYRSIDHAMNTACCCVWVAVNPDTGEHGGVPSNASYVYREYWRENASVDQHAAMIRSLSAGERILFTVIDRSTYQKNQSRPEGHRVALADLYFEEGLNDLVPSVGDQWARVERINVAQRRGARVSERCNHLIEQIPEYIADQNKITGEFKVVNKTKFHAVDAYGMALMVIPLDSRTPDDIYDALKPDYLRRSGLDNLTRRHHTAEWKRITAAEEKLLTDRSTPITGSVPAAEFWGDEDMEVEIFTGHDPWVGEGRA